MSVTVCVCGHRQDDHFRGTGMCMASARDVVWECACVTWRPVVETDFDRFNGTEVER